VLLCDRVALGNFAHGHFQFFFYAKSTLFYIYTSGLYCNALFSLNLPNPIRNVDVLTNWQMNSFLKAHYSEGIVMDN
jgi:hypothetical protein